jgi:hypothetical protein
MRLNLFGIYFSVSLTPPVEQGTINMLNKKLEILIMNLDALHAAVEAEVSVTASAVALIEGFQAQLDALKAAQEAAGMADQSAVDAMVAQLEASKASLAAAVSANTPAAPVVEAPVEEAPVAPVDPVVEG